MIKFAFALILVSAANIASGAEYQKATEGNDVVRDKLYPKNGRVELNGPDFGLILNQSYVDTYLVHGGINYYFSETWGAGGEFALGMNQDKGERKCIETFYIDPNNTIVPECGAQGDPDSDLSSGGGKYGPAYVPIRELKYMFIANAVWSPIYGKQLFMLRNTNYFDLFFTFGGGLAMSDFYARRDTLNNGNAPSGDVIDNGGTKTIPDNIGASAAQSDSYGDSGRPIAESQTNLLVNVGVGQRFHFAKRFNVKVELRNFTLLGTQSGFENMFALWGGFGMRF